MAQRQFDIPDTIFAFAVPMLPARDVDATVAFFESVLGFRRDFSRGAPTEHAGMKRDGAELQFFRCDDPAVLAQSSCRIRVDGIDQLYARCVNRGVVHPGRMLAETSWGHREFAMLDPDGVCVAFFQPLRP
jgi:catechol 2,3-dioxygenase-like lactoylglutathione lyase family enzyme